MLVELFPYLAGLLVAGFKVRVFLLVCNQFIL
jgi:hypothetical protein